MIGLIFEAAHNLLLHATRSLLAALGIIFGVASVICMLSISEVARQDVVKRIERLGIQNLIVDTVEPEEVRASRRARNSANNSRETRVVKFGITRQDLKTLAANVPAIDAVVPMATRVVDASSAQHSAITNVVGTTADYCDVMNHFPRNDGRFVTDIDEQNRQTICVLGYETARELFSLVTPIGQLVKIEGVYFEVVGVMEKKGETGAAGKLSDPDKSIYVPYETAFARFQLAGNAGRLSGEQPVEVNRAILRIPDTSMLVPVSKVTNSMLNRLHDLDDFSVAVPYALLNEQQQAEQIFRWVMGSLAAISLLVGGIGIMNIMLANATERKSEIGLRRALGAKRADIVALFVSESLLLCVIGGGLGVMVGLGLAQLIGRLAAWTVVYHAWSVPLGMTVSVLVGLVFGTVPAFGAARQDPVLALRSE